MRVLILLWAFIFCCFSISAQIIERPTGIPQPFVTILQTEPEQPIEGGRVTVYFRFTNRIATTLNGWIGGEIWSGTSAPGRSAIDWPIINLEKDKSVDGAIMVNTSDAGIGKTLRVFFYERQDAAEGMPLRKSSPLYSVGEKELGIAALINFKLNSFTINHTRARSTDSDWGSLYAVVDDIPVMTPVSIWMGNFQDGTYPFKGTDADNKRIENMETGPVALVPGQNSTLYIAYTMYNGGGIDQRKNFLRGYAEATANPIMFHGPRPGTSEAFTALKVLNPFFNAIGACDGFVVMDTITINTNGIFTNTVGGNKDFRKRYNSEEYASQTGCGNTSDYEVSSSIRRMSNYLRSGDFEPPVFIKLTANRTVNVDDRILAESNRIYKISWQKTQSIDYKGNFITVDNAPYGYIDKGKYHAPSKIDRPTLVILRGNLVSPLLDAYNPPSLSVLNNGPLKEVTAIIQLLPGVTESKAKSQVPPTEVPPPPPPSSGEDYGKPNTDKPDAKEKIVKNYIPPINVTGEWKYKITSSGGSVFSGIVTLQQNGTSISGNMNVSDRTKSTISGNVSGETLNLSRDTGLETIQYYTLNKKLDTYFVGTYQNKGKYPDSGTVEFFK